MIKLVFTVISMLTGLLCSDAYSTMPRRMDPLHPVHFESVGRIRPAEKILRCNYISGTSVDEIRRETQRTLSRQKAQLAISGTSLAGSGWYITAETEAMGWKAEQELKKKIQDEVLKDTKAEALGQKAAEDIKGDIEQESLGNAEDPLKNKENNSIDMLRSAMNRHMNDGVALMHVIFDLIKDMEENIKDMKEDIKDMKEDIKDVEDNMKHRSSLTAQQLNLSEAILDQNRILLEDNEILKNALLQAGLPLQLLEAKTENLEPDASSASVE